MLNEKIKKIGFAVLLLICSERDMFPYVPSRDYPSVKITTLDFIDGAYFDTQSFCSSNEPVIEDSHGDKIVSPWYQYDLVDLNRSMAEFSRANGNPPKDYLETFLAGEVLSLSSDSLKYDMIQKRTTYGLDFQTGIVFKDIFKKSQMDFTGRLASLNKSRLSNVDFFCDLSSSILQSSSRGEYVLSQDVSKPITNPADTDLSTIQNVELERVRFALEKIRDKMQKDLGFDTYLSRQVGLTDIICRVGFKKCFYKALRCKRIDLYSGLIFTLPTGQKANSNKALSFDFGYPSSTIGFFSGIDALLRRDLSVGLGFSMNFGYDAYQIRRIPIQFEPAQLSPLLANVFTRYGKTYSITPYIQWKNVFMERLDVRVGFAYSEHLQDSYYLGDNDLKFVSPIIKNTNLDKMYVSEEQEKYLSKDEKKEKMEKEIESRKSIAFKQEALQRFTAWDNRFVELKMNYRLGNTQIAEAGTVNCFFALQKPFDSKNAIKNYRITLGMNMIF